jgi:hypothetical protein
MGETLPSWKPACNLSVSVQLSEQKTSSDAGAFLLREVLDRSGVIESLDRQLLDDRDPARSYSHLWCMRGKEGGVSC